MIDKTIIDKLQAVVGKGNILTAKADLVTYSYDSTAALSTQIPDIVVLPSDADQVQKIVNIARTCKIPITPRGAGTNLSGGTIPVEKGIVLSFQRMCRIIDIDVDNAVAVVEPGVVIQHLNDRVGTYGLIYPPDPGSVATATMGGSVAENSGGLRGLKYGVTKHYVLGVEVILASGQKIRLGGKAGNSVSTHDITSLFVGSEGTLGVITEITAKLVPAPKHRKSMLALFSNMGDAGNTVSGIIRAHVIPATLEIMDKTTIMTAENYGHFGLPANAEALLLIEVDGMSETVVNDEAAVVAQVVTANNGELKIATSESEREQLWAARRAALPALAQLNNCLILEDATVPRSRIPEMLVACQQIANKYALRMGTFGHAGDGNLHPTIVADKNDHEEMHRVHKAVDEIFATTLGFGGTLSGEHGIGISKKKYLIDEIQPNGIALMRNIKSIFDPHRIMNPCKMIPG